MSGPTQRGMTLVELMVGLTIGLLIALIGSALLVGQIRENRGLVQEARLTQDLRIAADIVARDLRRAGYRGGEARGPNAYAAITVSGAASDAVSLSYSRDTLANDRVDANEQFGFRLRNGAIELQLGAANWQALTDATTFTVTSFTIAPALQDIALESSCAHNCSSGISCPPHTQVRSFTVTITAKLISDAAVVRTARSQAHTRADAVTGTCSS